MRPVKRTARCTNFGVWLADRHVFIAENEWGSDRYSGLELILISSLAFAPELLKPTVQRDSR